MSGELTPTHQRALQILAQEEKARTLTVISTIRDMKTSEFFRQNWDQLLIAAPNCLELLGNVNAVASTKFAETTPLTAPAGKFVFLQDYGNLKGGLSQLSSQGAKSFTVARINMDLINSKSGSVRTQLEIIIAGLSDPQAPMSSVLNQLETLKKNAEACYKAAVETQESMVLWSNVCMELHDACSAESATTATKFNKNQTLLELAEMAKTVRVKQEADSKKELDRMDKEVKDAKETYKKALDAMPTGMDLVGQQVLLGLGEAVGACLQIGATAAAASINPVGGIASGAKTLAGEVDRYAPSSSEKKQAVSKKTSTGNTKDKAEGDAKTPSKANAAAKKSTILAKLTTTFIRRARPKKAEDGSTLPETGKAEKTGKPAGKVDANVKTEPDTKPKEYGTYDLSGKYMADDKALAIAPAIKASIGEIKEIIVGSPEGIKWESVLKPAAPAKSTVSDLAQVSYTLDRLLKDFRPTQGGLASQLAVAIMTEAIGVADDLETEATRGIGLGTWVKPDRKSEFFKDLDTRITRCASTALALDAASKSTPGGVGGGSATLHPPKSTTEERIANMNYKASVAEQAVKSATTKMLSTQETYKATLDTYMKQSEQLLQVQDNLLKARQEVESLTAEKMTLESVKKTLVQCIGYLAELKDRISNLVVFFSGLKNLIDTCIGSHVEPFKKEIEIYARENTDKGLLYNKYYRDLIFKFTLRIMANFALFKDVSGMYLEVDRKCIQEGLLLVDRLNISNIDSNVKDEVYFSSQKKKLSDFCKRAEETVHSVVRAKQQEIISGLEKRITDIGASIEKFPADFQPDQKAIESVSNGAGITQSLTEAECAAKVSPINTLVAGQEEETVALGDDDEEM
ncbi:hypothetical protein HYE68_003111 [Fusarium pseudograminearum]|nr:hypothetical protein HYE68_003111 [Fusarium pseudograminearum]